MDKKGESSEESKEEYEIEWTKTAQRSLHKIVDFIARDKPLAAEKFRQEIILKVGLLGNDPQLGRIVPDGEAERNLRRSYQKFLMYRLKSMLEN